MTPMTEFMIKVMNARLSAVSALRTNPVTEEPSTGVQREPVLLRGLRRVAGQPSTPLRVRQRLAG